MLFSITGTSTIDAKNYTHNYVILLGKRLINFKTYIYNKGEICFLDYIAHVKNKIGVLKKKHLQLITMSMYLNKGMEYCRITYVID